MAKRTRARTGPYRVRVTDDIIRSGIPGDCFRCAVAVAVQRATGDTGANVYDDCDGMWIEVHSLSIPCPSAVRQFVWDYDGLPRDAAGHPFVPDPLPASLQPFVFELPPMGNPEWQERCAGCNHQFDSHELDDDGFCAECRAE